MEDNKNTSNHLEKFWEYLDGNQIDDKEDWSQQLLQMVILMLEHGGFSNKDLKTLTKQIKTKISINEYFQYVDKKLKYLPSNVKLLIDTKKIEVLDYKTNTDPWFCHTRGKEWFATIKIEGLEDLVYVRRHCHSSKYTDTREIKIGAETFVYSIGEYSIPTNYNKTVLQILHDALDIPLDKTLQIINLLFIKDRFSAIEYIDGNFPSLDKVQADESLMP